MITGADSQAGVSVQAGVGTVALSLARPWQKQRTPLPM